MQDIHVVDVDGTNDTVIHSGTNLSCVYWAQECAHGVHRSIGEKGNLISSHFRGSAFACAGLVPQGIGGDLAQSRRPVVPD